MKAFFDIDTQIDFVFPAGALYTPDAGRVIPAVGALNRYAAANGITLISTMCAHGEDSEEFKVWGPHCVVGTVGQQKPAATLVENQIFIEKDVLDVFSNPDFVPLLDRLGIDDCYVYGVLTEFCVKCAAMGLLRIGRRVSLVTDAIAHYSATEGAKVIAGFEAAGGRTVTTGELYNRA
ncbi:MAG TPA: isochorismatase family cysteine hydrolase [Bryobacteraceae bacterium]|jgi:nicotinamidase/pyrazinamidase|nr:isochorismatase family cysteine hydrolase [Bryobacteraceae bacterium]